ncbi:hypothetical protein [Streptomyces sp. NPDC056244]|uniref:TOTE conflict system archaeo-eukaryotic primase domain-containing protein n=1 Tax=Streptomyces sp. NPDC056244 TaxID=3345762 RepID=UPI0035D77428
MSGVVDWSDCNDPDELRIGPEVALQEKAELREELAQIKAENVYLRARLGKTAPTVPAALPPVADPVPAQPAVGVGELPYADATSGTAAKIALFRILFAGREDVYARPCVSSRTGRTGWSPAEDNPFDKTKDDAGRVFWPLTDETVYDHLAPSSQGRSELHIDLDDFAVVQEAVEAGEGEDFVAEVQPLRVPPYGLVRHSGDPLAQLEIGQIAQGSPHGFWYGALAPLGMMNDTTGNQGES